MSIDRNKDFSGWLEFWRDSQRSNRLVIDVSTLVAARRMSRHFNFLPGQSLLDYGCGPGTLTAYLSQQGMIVLGTDINEAQIADNRTRYPLASFMWLSEPDSIKHIKPGKFDYIVLLSVVQYLSTKDMVKQLVATLSALLKPGGKLIIADVIDSNTSRIRDAMAALWHCLRAGQPLVFFKFAMMLPRSGWGTKAPPVLMIEEADFYSIAGSLGLKLSKHSHLTAHPTRKTYAFESFDSSTTSRFGGSAK